MLLPQVYRNSAKLFMAAFFSLICFIEVNSQTIDTTRVRIEDGWIEIMKNKIVIDISSNNSFERFEVKTSTEKFAIYPNTSTNCRLKFSYKFISFGFQFAPKFLPGNGDNSLRGRTRSFGLGTSLIFRHWFGDLLYSQVKGYYLFNTDDYIQRAKGDPFIQFPDLHYNGLSFKLGYFNNKKFSFRSLTSQTERQLKSAGSFVPEINLRYFIIDDKSAAASTQKSNNMESSIGPGYIYTFVVKERFYLSLGLVAGLGYLNTKVTTRQPTGNLITNQDNFIFRWDGKTGIGYNGRKFYSGLYATLSGTKYKQENTTVLNFETRVFYHLFFGIRFATFKYLDRQETKMENKFPMKKL